MNVYYWYFTAVFRVCFDCQTNKISEIHSTRFYSLVLQLHSESIVQDIFDAI